MVRSSLLGHYAQTEDLSFTFIVSVKDVADLASFCGSPDCTVLSCAFYTVLLYGQATRPSSVEVPELLVKNTNIVCHISKACIFQKPDLI